jgi:hypothetical protein
MKKILLLFLFLLFQFLALAGGIEKPRKNKEVYHSLKTQIELQKGRKLNVLEKVALKIVVKKIKRDPRPIHKDAKLAFILGILSFFLLSTIIGGLLLGIFAVIFGVKAIRKTGKNKEFRGRGFAILGILFALFPIILLTAVWACLLLEIYGGLQICGF